MTTRILRIETYRIDKLKV